MFTQILSAAVFVVSSVAVFLQPGEVAPFVGVTASVFLAGAEKFFTLVNDKQEALLVKEATKALLQEHTDNFEKGKRELEKQLADLHNKLAFMEDEGPLMRGR